jgi:chromate transporter
LSAAAATAAPAVPFRTAVRAWTEVAAHSFGGPAGQIAVLHRVVVDEHGWLSEERFLHALSYCMLLPGPEAQQLATYVGWLLHGVRGGLVAGSLFILPGFVTILALSVAYVEFRQLGVVTALFFGVKPAVAAIVAEAVMRLRSRALKGRFAAGVAVAAFVAIFFLDVPFPLIVGGAAALGYLRHRLGGAPIVAVTPSTPAPPLSRLARTVTTWLAVWWLPVLLLLAIAGPTSVFVREAAFFSKAAVVTFGGAYAVLAYVAQQAVGVFHWLAPREMLDGLGLAETTPGPLIMVVQFVGFLGAHGTSGASHPVVAGIAGSIVATWVTFAPCFLFIFAGAPYVEWLRGRQGLSAALGGVMAAVVGVVLNLAVWFALHVVFATVSRAPLGPAYLWIPDVHSLDVAAATIMIGALVAVLRYRAGMFMVLGGGALLGLLYRAVL